jgi:Uma2 family endonuclease
MGGETVGSNRPIRSTPHNNGYPTADGRPIAESDWHRELLCGLIDTLRRHFAAEPLVYVSGALLVYYEEGKRRRRVAPDVFVIKGVPKHDRPNFLRWLERRGPQLVIELTSLRTRREDFETKLPLYRDVLKVRELFIYDPLRDYLDPPLQGYRLRQGRYRRISPYTGRLPSRELGLDLVPDGWRLRLQDPRTGRLLLSTLDRLAETEAEEPAERRLRQLEAEVAYLRRQIAELQGRRDDAAGTSPSRCTPSPHLP